MMLLIFAILMVAAVWAVYPPPPFDLELADVTLYLAVATTCDKETYPTRTYVGPSKGFEYKATLYDSKTDTNGMLGIHEGKIFVLFRGTTSAKNWLDDGEAWQDDPSYPGCPECAIHHGFHRCMDSVRGQMLAALADLREAHPSYPVVVGGHSLGCVKTSVYNWSHPTPTLPTAHCPLPTAHCPLPTAHCPLPTAHLYSALQPTNLTPSPIISSGALATLAAVDIINAGLPKSQLLHVTFGSPRVGNPAFAAYANSLLPTAQRLTHWKDPVPHAPPSYLPLVGKYQHILSEVYEDESHALRACVGVDDDQCSMQWRDSECQGADHTLYLNLCTSCSCV